MIVMFVVFGLLSFAVILILREESGIRNESNPYTQKRFKKCKHEWRDLKCIVGHPNVSKGRNCYKCDTTQVMLYYDDKWKIMCDGRYV